MEKKNVWLLPTDKPSRILQSLKVIQLLDKEWLSPIGNVNRNIYITSSEKPKEGEYGLGFAEENQSHFVFKHDGSNLAKLNALCEDTKKIIITSDTDLIANRIKKISEKFLRWFVQNPSCEFVEVKKQMLCDYCGQEYCDNLRCRGYKDSPYYEIIIPQEELSKQYKCTECNWIGVFNEMKNEQSIDYDQYCCPKCNNVMYDCRIDKWYLEEEPKQETFEESVNAFKKTDVYINYIKQKQGRMYSEEEFLKFSEWVSDNDWVYLPSKSYWVNEEQEESEQKFTTKELFEQFKNK
jgi:hypothetical protein